MERVTPAPEDEDIWANLVDIVLRKMPVCTTQEEKAQHIELRRNEALQLAAAALHAAGEHVLAENLLS
ncbi:MULTISPECIES: hypothetical protein [Klebsiella/Raoultella group]|uniref:hypothetical protein n=1 Tax=Klebsiella/Raoultella group TaxID=2890311 RepID=UPI00164BC414|nr:MULTISPECIES: hypothetical protein [Klebsiella/Raoultella group]MBC4754940.1 hypothetical protein [Klebsiella variicola]MDV1448275.1 hypothetical protein [Raoultella planticola]MDV1564001.1 hypothetical protein [Raoultella planticola]MDV1570579.1 hypothetical protein [Raoultella planticola]MDV1630860.1 hypothetical protein [Raoultella planticola]